MAPSYTSPPDKIAYQNIVWDIVRQIPPGHVTTYGQIAAMIPPPTPESQRAYDALGPRWVGSAMAGCPGDVPWQRVINSQGKISHRQGAALQRQLLEKEGVVFDEGGKVDLTRFGWGGPLPEWCAERGLLPILSSKKNQQRLF